MQRVAEVLDRMESPELSSPGEARASSTEEATVVADATSTRTSLSSPQASSSTNLEARLQKLEDGVLGIVEALKERKYVDPPPPASVMQGAPPRDWERLDKFAQDYSVDKEGARDGLLFMTYVEVLRLFGRPTSMNHKNEWFYSRRKAPVGRVELVMLAFVGGYVTEARAELME